MNRDEQIRILCAAITGLIASNQNHMVGDEGCGDAAFRLVDGAFEILNAVQIADDQYDLFDEVALRKFQADGRYLARCVYSHQVSKAKK